MVEFYTFLPELLTEMPIEKASIKSFNWYKSMVDDYNQSNKNAPHTSKCPGILSICNNGWIQRAYQDFKISTNGNGVSFQWQSEINQSKLNTQFHNLMGDYVSSHPPQQLFKYNEFKQNTLKTIVKIQSPWVVKIPDGYFLLSMPIPYSDINHFTAAHGLVKGVQWLNVQLFWHTLNDEVIIKKGTPLCQYILIKNDKTEFSVNELNSEIFSKLPA